MLKIDHSYYSRVSNEEVIQRATMELNNADCLDLDWEQFCTDSLLRRDDFKTICMVGDIIEDRQQVMLGHVLRRPMTGIVRRVTCNEQLVRPFKLYKRPGAPRSHWLEDNLQLAHTRLNNNPDTAFDISNTHHVTCIREAAANRTL